MESLRYPFRQAGRAYSFELAFVAGTTENDPFLFGSPGEEQAIHVPDFFIATCQTTQALWQHILGDDQDRSMYRGDTNPVEHVSWNELHRSAGFLEKLGERFGREFRLPTETEWEYAARGGRSWREGFRFSGTDDMDLPGWYDGNSGPYHDRELISRMKNGDKLTRTHPVGQKKKNQLGLFDMNGNVWEWCADWFIRDPGLLPRDGSAYNIPTGNKVLRGGCHHNWSVHCTNTKRYEIGPEFFDGCIGFRVALSAL